MTRSRRSLSLLVTSSILLAASLVAAVAPVTTSNAAAAAPLPEIYNPAPEQTVREWGPGVSKRVVLSFGRTGDLSTASSAKLTLVDETATRGSDYTAAAYTKILRWPVGTYFVRLYLNVRGDAVVEPDETLRWHLSDPTGATIRADSVDGSVVIINDDSAEPSTFSVDDAHHDRAEGNTGSSPSQFVVRRSGSTASLARVRIATVDGTARAPGDYTAKSTTLYFGVGDTFKIVDVRITNDLIPEPDETFSVQLSAPVHATITDSTAVATIVDDDSDATPALSVADAWIFEGDDFSDPVSFPIRRDGDLRGTSTVTVATADGTAQAPADYVAKTATVTFRPGEVYKWVTVSLKGDRVIEPDKHFFITLSNASTGSTIGDPVARIDILDQDD